MPPGNFSAAFTITLDNEYYKKSSILKTKSVPDHILKTGSDHNILIRIRNPGVFGHPAQDCWFFKSFIEKTSIDINKYYIVFFCT